MAARLLARLLLSTRDLLAAQVAGWWRTARAAVRRAWAARPRGDRALAVLVTLAALGGTGAAVLEQASRPARLPAPLDWRAAASLLARDGRPGDAVAVAPAWLERARTVVPAGLPLLSMRRLAGEPLPGIRRVWLLSAPAAPLSGWELELDLARRAARADAQRLGALEVIRYDLSSPLQPIASLADLSPALAATREAGGEARRCLVVQATPGQATAFPLGAARLGRTLAGHATLLPGAGDAPVRLSLLADGQEVGALEVGPADGRRAWELDTARLAFATHQLAVVAVAAGPARPVCLEGLALP